MRLRILSLALRIPALLVAAAPLHAQIPLVVHGRVEDAVSGDPIEGVRVLATDSSATVFTDSTGMFALPLAKDAPLQLQAERLGYSSQRFDLEDEAPSRISVLRLEPAPLAIAGIEVVEESAVTAILSELNSRSQGSPWMWGRDDLERLTPAGSVWDFVRSRNPRMYPCRQYPGQICLPPRARTTSNANPETFVPVCVDGQASFAGHEELASMDIGSAVIVEVQGMGRVSSVFVYTPRWVLMQARRGRDNISRLSLQCAGVQFPGGFTGDPTYDSIIQQPGSEPPIPPGN